MIGKFVVVRPLRRLSRRARPVTPTPGFHPSMDFSPEPLVSGSLKFQSPAGLGRFRFIGDFLTAVCWKVSTRRVTLASDDRPHPVRLATATEVNATQNVLLS